MPATRARRSRRVRRVLVGLLVVGLSLLLVVAVDVALVASRFQQHTLALSATPGPRTWLILGLDDREHVSDELGEYTGPAEDQPGTRADVIIVVTQMDDAVRALSIPRDLVVGHAERGKPGARNRLGVFWRESPQRFIDMLCSEVGVPVDHVITVDLQAFVSVVDALGGVTVTVPYPLWDGDYLELDAGEQTLDGITALAYVRSRLGAAKIDGEWVPEPNGEAARQQRQADVLAAILAKARANPLRLQAVAWQASPHIGLSKGTSLLDLAPLAELSGVQIMPTSPLADGLLAEMNAASERAVAERGYASECVPG